MKFGAPRIEIKHLKCLYRENQVAYMVKKIKLSSEVQTIIPNVKTQ